ncbi:hypothetical protein ASD58_11845 [Duganella sp. Root1480D1]|nr:hypothetical protein ASD58_11845 [Duganella sp. Root1480D1]
MIELHFGIFVLLALLKVYQDWRVIVAAAAFAAVHHLSFNFLQQAGFGTISQSASRASAYRPRPTAAPCKPASTACTRTLTEAHAGLDAISDAAHAIASGNQEPSARIEQQAAKLLRTVGTVQQLAQAVRQTADDAHAATELVSRASQDAVQGGPAQRHGRAGNPADDRRFGRKSRTRQPAGRRYWASDGATGGIGAAGGGTDARHHGWQPGPGGRH